MPLSKDEIKARNAAYMRRWRAEMKAKGFIKVSCYITPGQRDRLVKYVNGTLDGEIGS